MERPRNEALKRLEIGRESRWYFLWPVFLLGKRLNQISGLAVSQFFFSISEPLSSCQPLSKFSLPMSQPRREAHWEFRMKWWRSPPPKKIFVGYILIWNLLPPGPTMPLGDRKGSHGNGEPVGPARPGEGPPGQMPPPGEGPSGIPSGNRGCSGVGWLIPPPPSTAWWWWLLGELSWDTRSSSSRSS